MGGVFGAAARASNDVRNLLALCRSCHDATEHAGTWAECVSKGWRCQTGTDPLVTPALLYTVNGHGWWYLTHEAGFRWCEWTSDYRIT